MIPLFKVFVAPQAIDKVKETFDCLYVGEGPKVKEFEHMLQPYLGIYANQIITTNSATSALHLLLHALKDPAELLLTDEFQIQTVTQWPGFNSLEDKILTTSLTCFATNSSILAHGMKLKFYDIDKQNLGPDWLDLERKLSPNTKIIIIVPWGGLSPNLYELDKILMKAKALYGFKPLVILDNAHAFGSKFDNKWLSEFEHICVYSFQAIKSLTTIDGGAITCPYNNLAHRLRLLRWYGLDRSQGQSMRCTQDITKEKAGFKFHMNDVSAAVGLANLPLIMNNIKVAQENAKQYTKQLLWFNNNPKIKGTQNNNTKYPVESSTWLYTIFVENRDKFIKYMAENGVETSPVHQPNHQYSCFKEFATPLPHLDSIADKIVCLPAGHWVTKEDREKIVELVNKGW